MLKFCKNMFLNSCSLNFNQKKKSLLYKMILQVQMMKMIRLIKKLK